MQGHGKDIVDGIKATDKACLARKCEENGALKQQHYHVLNLDYVKFWQFENQTVSLPDGI